MCPGVPALGGTGANLKSNTPNLVENGRCEGPGEGTKARWSKRLGEKMTSLHRFQV